MLIVDDLIATGGTAAPAVRLARAAAAQVIGCSFLVELEELGGCNPFFTNTNPPAFSVPRTLQQVDALDRVRMQTRRRHLDVKEIARYTL